MLGKKKELHKQLLKNPKKGLCEYRSNQSLFPDMKHQYQHQNMPCLIC